MTSGTCGPPSTISSNNAALRSSLASKLRERTEILGSTLYRLTWTQRVMPSGLRKPALRASARPTSDPAITGWPSPIARDYKGAPLEGPHDRGVKGPPLNEMVRLCGWTTPRVSDPKDGTLSRDRARGVNMPEQAQLTSWPPPTVSEATAGARPPDMKRGPAPGMHETVRLTGWPTPSAMDTGNTGDAWEGRRERVKADLGNGNGFGMILPMAAQLAGWPTTTTTDGNRGDYQYDKGNPDQPRPSLSGLAKLCGPARLTASGEMLIGSSAETTPYQSGGQLSPAHSLWLMLGPFATAWVSCGERVTLSRSRKPKSS